MLLDRTSLPADAQSKGYIPHVVQDLLIQADNTRFLLEKYWSPSEGKTYIAEVPAGYEGGFGPTLQAWLKLLYYQGNMSEPKVHSVLTAAGIQISEGQVSNLVLKVTAFEAEIKEAYVAALQNCPWQGTDDTSTKINGVAHYCHVVSCPLGTFYSTRSRKDRLTVIEVLRGESEGHYRLNEEAFEMMKKLGVSDTIVAQLREGQAPTEPRLQEEQWQQWKSAGPRCNETTWARIKEACALADYHTQDEIPVVKLILTDAAKQYRNITEEKGGCLVHEGRLYKKLLPVVEAFQKERDTWLDGFWGWYRRMNEYRKAPTSEASAQLEKEFDELVNQQPMYEELRERLEATKARKAELLIALAHPEVPLHNNDSELAARQRARKRDVSFAPRTMQGAYAWDLHQSAFETLRKLGTPVLDWLRDRLTGANKIPSIADLIAQKAKSMQLGASWQVPAPTG